MEAVNEEEDFVHFETLLEKLEDKLTSVKCINDKIHWLTNAADTPKELVEAEECTLDV